MFLQLKIAEFSGEMGVYKRAVEIYEEVAKAAVENNLLKFSARGYLLNAGICYLCYCNSDDLDIKVG
jgi:alpha-soluble NSF attachment protein